MEYTSNRPTDKTTRRPARARERIGRRPTNHSVKFDSRLLKITVFFMLAPIMVTLDITVVNVAQQTFIDKFSSTQAIVAWTMTAYTLALAAVIPLAGWAANRFGTKRLTLGSLLLFSMGSLLCAIAPNAMLLVTFRALQGVGGGMLTPLAVTILTHEAGPERLGRALTIGSVPIFIAPICGPILGGWLIDSFGWHWIFLINVPIGLLALVLGTFVLRKDQSRPAESFDVVGMLLLSPGLVALLYGASLMPGRGAVDDPHVYVPVVVGSALVGVFVFHTLHRTSNPLIDLRLLRNRVVGSANATRFLFAVAFFGTCLLVPEYFQKVLGTTPLESGLFLLPQTLASAAVTPLAGWLMEKRGPRDVVLAGMALNVAGMGVFIYGISQQRTHIPVLLGGLAMFGIGVGCSITPVVWTAVHTLKDREVAHGSTLINVNYYTAAAVGPGLMSVLLTGMFNRSPDIVVARRADLIREAAAKRGVAPDLSKLPEQVLAPDFMEHVTRELSRAYAVVFAVAAILFATTFAPVRFLPNKPGDLRARTA